MAGNALGPNLCSLTFSPFNSCVKSSQSCPLLPQLLAKEAKLSLFLASAVFSLGASQVALVVKNLPANAGDIRDVGSIPGLGRSPGGGNATHSCILAWIIPWTEEPGGLQSWGHKESDATEHTHKP